MLEGQLALLNKRVSFMIDAVQRISKETLGYVYALLAAVLFGASTPAAKWLLNGTSPWLLAGLLYLGSGLGLFLVRQIGRLIGSAKAQGALRGRDWMWLAAATLFGGIFAPALLMIGLARADAAAASLLLNIEGVFTALVAWFIFKENFDRRILLGMVLILAGGALLSWHGMPGFSGRIGPLCIVAACLCWSVDNNLTKQIAASDALQIAMTKGLVAGATNTALALSLSRIDFAPSVLLSAGVVGFLGYGVSLLCFVMALRHIGAARTGAYFSIAPFVGATVAISVGQDSWTWQLGGAGLLMASGVWLHLSEHHEHEHIHEELEHEHSHIHDEHHQHTHSAGGRPGEPHSHPHRHARLVHTHAHFPDIHHTHQHDAKLRYPGNERSS